jgi:hypothetical protein
MTELDVIESKIEENKANMTIAISSGGCKDFGEYQRICGVIYGLNLVKSDIQDLRKQAEKFANE